MLVNRNAFHFARLSEHVEWGSMEAQTQLQNMTRNFENHTGMDAASAAIARLAGMVHQQAALMSFIDVFYLLTVLFGSLALFVMVIRKPPESAGGGGGGH